MLGREIYLQRQMIIETKPLISIIIPFHRGERFIVDTLNTAYAQTYPHKELIIVHNHKESSFIQSLLDKYPQIKPISSLSNLPATSRNKGWREAKGKYISFLDQDDLWHPNKLDLQSNALLENSELEFVLCNQRIFLDKNKDHIPQTMLKGLTRELYSEKASYCPSAILIKKDFLRRIGGFSEQFPFYSEADLFLKSKKMGFPYKVLKQALVLKRFHGQNLCYKRGLLATELLHILRQHNFKQEITPITERA